MPGLLDAAFAGMTSEMKASQPQAIKARATGSKPDLGENRKVREAILRPKARPNMEGRIGVPMPWQVENKERVIPNNGPWT